MQTTQAEMQKPNERTKVGREKELPKTEDSVGQSETMELCVAHGHNVIDDKRVRDRAISCRINHGLLVLSLSFAGLHEITVSSHEKVHVLRKTPSILSISFGRKKIENGYCQKTVQ
ncbi:hypothetical protein TNIN_111271 [Trichonephila inaurata madagascariensis]|uniref:Uncharacterized protein n=1 Tax=Trichonephila inaurata madagascariensis TaxID=2747483 RepID=A0A8X6XWF8_9ARAC|nr:hypothetical protein TNIN_111271 [Trichonephila inaurata madagascariensis]